MSIELNKQQINITEDKCNASVKAITESDIIVPDSKADCLRILEVDALPNLIEKHISKDYITLSGSVVYTIVYLGERGAVETVFYSAPFSKQIDAAGCDDTMQAVVKCTVPHVEYSVINSRKINVKSVMDIHANAYSAGSVSLVESVTGDVSMPAKVAAANNFNLAVCSEQHFDMEESVKLPQPGPDVDSVLKYDLRISDSELKVVLNKVVTRGNYMFSILYMHEGEIYSAQNEIPFTHIADVEGISPDMYTTADYDVGNIACERNTDDDGTMSVLDIKASVCITIRGYDEKTVEYISDIYSPDYNIKPEKKQISMTEMVDAETAQCTVSETFSSDSNVERIYSVTSSSFVDEVILNSNSVTVNGFVNTAVICKAADEGGDIYSINRQLPFSCSLPVARSFDSENAFAEASSFVEHESYSIEGGNNIRLRIIVRVNSSVKRSFTVNAITDIDFDENDKTDKSSQSGITIYFVQSGDDMWNIAKRYHTTASEITEINSLDENTPLTPGMQLLIPKRSGRVAE